MKKEFIILVIIMVLAVISTAQNFNPRVVSEVDLKFTDFYNPLQNEHVLNFNYTASRLTTTVSPDGSYKLLSSIITSASQSIYIEVYQFWSEDIFQLINQTLHENPSIKVRVLIENDTGYRNSLDNADEYNRYYANKFYQLSLEGFDVRVKLETTWYYYHGKIIIVDNETALISSDNFVPTAYPSNPGLIEKIVYSTPSRGWMAAINDQAVVLFYLKIFNEDFNDGKSYDPTEDGVGKAPPDYGTLSYNPYFNKEKTVFDVPVVPIASPFNSNDSLVNLILSANQTILIEQIYIQDSAWYLVDLLRYVHEKKNVTVMVILEDNSIGNYDDVKDSLESYGFHVIPAFVDINDKIFLHNKGIIVDDELVFVGSINWSSGAINLNREFGVIIKSRDIASFFRNVFSFDWNSSLVSGTEPFDSDGDGLPNYYEIEHGLNKTNPDTDGDGYSDYEEVYILHTDPLTPNIVETEAFIIYRPMNGSIHNTDEIKLNIKVNETLVSKIGLVLNGTFLENITNFVNGWLNTTIMVSEGNNLLEVVAYNSTDMEIERAKLRFLVDTTPPTVNIISPLNDSTFAVDETIRVKWIVTEINEYSSRVYLDGNLLAETGGNSYNISIPEVLVKTGKHTLNITVTDVAGNTGYDIVYFSVSKPLLTLKSITPTNNSKIYEETLEFNVVVKSPQAEIVNASINNHGETYFLEVKTLGNGEYGLSGRINVIESESSLTIGTAFYVFHFKIFYQIEKNPIVRFLYEYRYEIAILIVLVTIAIIKYKLKRR